ncbi:MAG: hypothetical protein HKN04_14310 [Rhodothermaceae bacterium]|nr:hypothetical protein [Rhodothermaceae bacterium]
MPDPHAPYLSVRTQDQDLALDVSAVLIEDGDRLIDKATLVVPDPHRPYTDFVREGWSLQIDLGWTGLHAVVFDGTVTRVRGYAGPNGQRYVTLIAFDLSYQMNREARSVNHVGTLSAIVQAVVTAYALPIGAVTVTEDPEFTEAAPLRQSAETDWLFLQRIAREQGAYAFVEYNEDASKFYFVSAQTLTGTEPIGELDYRNGNGSLLAFSYKRAAAQATPQRHVTIIDPVSGEMLTAAGAPALPDPPVAADTAQADLLGRGGSDLPARYQAAGELAASQSGNPADQRPITTLTGVPSDPALRSRAKRADPTRTQGWYGTGVAPGMPLLRAKSMLTLGGIGAWADGPWYVEQARHVVRGASYLTQFVVTR